MARACTKCGKKPMTGHNVSHSLRRTKRRFLPNLQWHRPIKGQKRQKICNQCLKTMNKKAK